MNLLIVDDEIFAIQGILDGVDWSNLEFAQIFTANSYEQAISIFAANNVDILMCDIEMPMRSGLDLIEWVRDNQPETVSIILSCHDRFDFARQALRLNCMEYCLKPATPHMLADVLKRASDMVRQNRQHNLFEDVGRHFAHVLMPGEEMTDERRSLAEEVAKHIVGHIEDSLSVEELAGQFFISADHLTRIFKKHFGKTVIDYITEQRMYLARELIKNSQLTITMISARVGYSNYSYFTKVFRRHYGMTPREYAQKYGK